MQIAKKQASVYAEVIDNQSEMSLNLEKKVLAYITIFFFFFSHPTPLCWGGGGWGGGGGD